METSSLPLPFAIIGETVSETRIFIVQKNILFFPMEQQATPRSRTQIPTRYRADTETVTYLDVSRVTKTRRQSAGNMTASQLARKRANDRLAQRAMRARNKARVESLEAEVRELRVKLNEQSSTALQQLIARNHALENELVRLMEQIRPDDSPSSLSMFHDTTIGSTNIRSNTRQNADRINDYCVLSCGNSADSLRRFRKPGPVDSGG
ncbi:hypothetical protein LMH87_001333 [Akanthomyces muscarius]|uniref:BZIP domain-containing protein n=1 Tax=Akanthomyces muscarius TaxID=2231603 RepID=A0A9W8QJ62_AKAMU|nr:hypothetical protein LMH87_001333 [Akanthomyces muscarius]KAJ4156120.1 hypothetical protein LMH87_001333 [Akanthomyces muscarius]